MTQDHYGSKFGLDSQKEIMKHIREGDCLLQFWIVFGDSAKYLAKSYKRIVALFNIFMIQ